MQKYAVLYVKYASVRVYILYILHLYALSTLLMGYEMGLAKGRGFSAKRSAGHF